MYDMLRLVGIRARVTYTAAPLVDVPPPRHPSCGSRLHSAPNRTCMDVCMLYLCERHIVTPAVPQSVRHHHLNRPPTPIHTHANCLYIMPLRCRKLSAPLSRDSRHGRCGRTLARRQRRGWNERHTPSSAYRYDWSAPTCSKQTAWLHQCTWALNTCEIWALCEPLALYAGCATRSLG